MNERYARAISRARCARVVQSLLPLTTEDCESLTGPRTRPATPFARRRGRVHRIPPRIRDDREPPLWGRDGGVIEVILAAAEAQYFSHQGWTPIC
jgi:hypothetical protein